MTGTKRIENIISKDDYINKDLIFILTYKYTVKNNDEFRLLCKVIKWIEKNIDINIENDKIIIGDTELECVYYEEKDDIFQFAKLLN